MSSDKRTILLVGWFFYPRVGGAETIMLNMVQGLKTKYNVVVLTSSVEGLPTEEKYNGIQIIRRDYLNPNDDGADFEKDFNEILKKYSPILVHFNNFSFPFVGCRKTKKLFELARNFGAKVIEHAHNAQRQNPESTREIRDLDWDSVVCVSQYVKSRWSELGTRARRIDVVYNGVNTKLFDKAEILPVIDNPQHNFLIFFPARIIRISTGEIAIQKNFDLLLKAGRTIKEKGIDNFTIIAFLNHSLKEKNARDNLKRLKNRIEKYNLADNVVFVEPVLPENMPAYYSSVDVVCVPSFEETFGLVYVEAMASGKVAIASDTGGPKEYIVNGVNGYTVDSDDEIQLADLLITLMKNSDLLKKIGTKAKEDSANLSSDLMVKNILKVYKTLGC